MTFKNEIIKFDGEKTGIITQVKSEDGNTQKFITLDGKPRIFNNLEVAKIMSNTRVENGNFTYFILYNDSKSIININKCRYIKKTHTFQYIDDMNGIIYNFVEKRTHKLSNLNYLIFDDGDTVRIDKELGVLRQKELMGYIADVASCLLGEKKEKNAIILLEQKRKELILHIKGTTAKIHISYNSKIMDINQMKTLTPGVRRIPFIKEMDKFTTFYMFISKDIGEGNRVGGKEIADAVMQDIIDDLQKYYSDCKPKVHHIDYNGFLDLED